MTYKMDPKKGYKNGQKNSRQKMDKKYKVCKIINWRILCTFHM